MRSNREVRMMLSKTIDTSGFLNSTPVKVEVVSFRPQLFSSFGAGIITGNFFVLRLHVGEDAPMNAKD